MGIYKGTTEITPHLGGNELSAVYLGDREIWTSFAPFEQDFVYQGSVEEFVIPYKGIYLLEVWGAEAGNSGGKGGYSLGYKYFDKGERLYICVGGKGVTSSSNASGGYNGGGNIFAYLGRTLGAGGGATHIAKVSGILSSIGYASFVTNGNGLIVAGGGGGRSSSGDAVGGSGGGLSGGRGSFQNSWFANGGTQTTGYAFGRGASDYAGSHMGGGGLYGGYGGDQMAGGGSGYIGGVPAITYEDVTYSPSTTNGVNSGNGKAKITRIA